MPTAASNNESDEFVDDANDAELHPQEENHEQVPRRSRAPQLIHRPAGRCSRQCKLTNKMREAMEYQAFQSTLALQEDSDPETEEYHPISFLSTINKDTMYFNEATRRSSIR